MISFSLPFLGLFFLSSAFLYDIVGSSNGETATALTATKTKPSKSISTISAIRRDSEDLCQVLLASKTSLLLDLQRSDLVPANFFAKCIVSDNCSSLSCQAPLGEEKVEGGIIFRLCDASRSVEFWMDKPQLWHHKESYVFPLGGASNGKMQRVEVKSIRKLRAELGPPEAKLFIKVFSDIFKNESAGEYFNFNSTLQICTSESENSCENQTLLNLFQHPLRVPCDLSKYSETRAKSWEFSSYQKRSNRPSRSVWNPEELHTKNTAPDNSGAGSASHKIGQPCDTSEIFSCGDGAGCANSKNGKGVCECLNNYVADSGGKCQRKPADIPIDPPVQPVNSSSSYSTALGALFSVFILLSIAAAVFFGTKYHVFSRIRNRLPLNLRCWPWPVLRRSSPLEDNVSMVNPIDQDDDEPLLL